MISPLLRKVRHGQRVPKSYAGAKWTIRDITLLGRKMPVMFFGKWPMFYITFHQDRYQRPDNGYSRVNTATESIAVVHHFTHQMFQQLRQAPEDISPALRLINLTVLLNRQLVDENAESISVPYALYTMALLLHCWLPEVEIEPKTNMGKEAALMTLLNLYVENFALEGAMMRELARYAKTLQETVVLIEKAHEPYFSVPNLWCTFLYFHGMRRESGDFAPYVTLDTNNPRARDVSRDLLETMQMYVHAMYRFGTVREFLPIPEFANAGLFMLRANSSDEVPIGCRFFLSGFGETEMVMGNYETCEAELTRRVSHVGLGWEGFNLYPVYNVVIGISETWTSATAEKLIQHMQSRIAYLERGRLIDSPTATLLRSHIVFDYDSAVNRRLRTFYAEQRHPLQAKLVVHKQHVLACLKDALIEASQYVSLVGTESPWERRGEIITCFNVPFFVLERVSPPRGNVYRLYTRMCTGPYYRARTYTTEDISHVDWHSFLQEFVMEAVVKLTEQHPLGRDDFEWKRTALQHYTRIFRTQLSQFMSELDLPVVTARTWYMFSFEGAISVLDNLRPENGFEWTPIEVEQVQKDRRVLDNKVGNMGRVSEKMWLLDDASVIVRRQAQIPIELRLRVPFVRAELRGLSAADKAIVESVFAAMTATQHGHAAWNMNRPGEDGERELLESAQLMIEQYAPELHSDIKTNMRIAFMHVGD